MTGGAISRSPVAGGETFAHDNAPFLTSFLMQEDLAAVSVAKLYALLEDER